MKSVTIKSEDGQKLIKVYHNGKVKNQPPDLTAGEFNRGE